MKEGRREGVKCISLSPSITSITTELGNCRGISQFPNGMLHIAPLLQLFYNSTPASPYALLTQGGSKSNYLTQWPGWGKHCCDEFDWLWGCVRTSKPKGLSRSLAITQSASNKEGGGESDLRRKLSKVFLPPAPPLPLPFKRSRCHFRPLHPLSKIPVRREPPQPESGF